ncbi:MAG: alpha/beta hydrolase [Pseudomonadales bacterium]
MNTVLIIALLLAAVTVFLTLRYRAADHSQYDAPLTAPLMADDAVSAAHQDVVAKLAHFNSQSVVDTASARKRMEELFYKDVDATITPVDVGGVPGEWVLAEGADPDARLLYLHGGAFRVGSPRSHRHLTNELSRRCGMAVLAIDYRMLPEHKMIACHEDAQTAYRWILENGPSGAGSASALFVAGDSAGGNLTLSVIAWARDQGLRAANGAIAFAPATDTTFSSPTWKANLKTDPFLGPSLGRVLGIPKFIMLIGSRITGGAAPNAPVLSPLLGELSELPPTLLQVSRDEMLYGDSQRYANKAQSQGGDVTLQVWPTMVHVFQAFPELPEADVALGNVANFVNLHRGVN